MLVILFSVHGLGPVVMLAAMDRLIVMDQGRIVEDGTHDALLARGGIYADLWRRQSGGFIDSAATAL